LKTTAESVESEALLEAVRELGVDYAQGFVIGRPRPLEIVLQELLSPGPARSRAAGAGARLRP
jgi:EAL domain-containing protein (putative c-di-GMP-specific phosphodiesterase class I)